MTKGKFTDNELRTRKLKSGIWYLDVFPFVSLAFLGAGCRDSQCIVFWHSKTIQLKSLQKEFILDAKRYNYYFQEFLVLKKINNKTYGLNKEQKI